MSDTPSLAAALADLQTQLPHVTKDATNPHFKSRYATLEAISAVLLPLLGKLGLSFSARPTLRDLGGEWRFVLMYVLRHAESGDEIVGYYPLRAGNPQAMGSEITYARRYALCAVTGLAPDEDDDGNDASGPPARASRQTPAQQRAARVPDPGRGQTPTEQREVRQRRTAEERAVAQAKAPDRPMDRGPLPDGDNVWQSGSPRPATAEQVRAITLRCASMKRDLPDLENLTYLDAARMITDLAETEALGTVPEDRPGTVSPGQARAIEALLTKLGCATGKAQAARDERHGVVLKYLPGVEALDSMNKLSYNEAATVIRGLSADTGDAKMPQTGTFKVSDGVHKAPWETAPLRIERVMTGSASDIEEQERDGPFLSEVVPDHAQRAANDYPEDWPS